MRKVFNFDGRLDEWRCTELLSQECGGKLKSPTRMREIYDESNGYVVFVLSVKDGHWRTYRSSSKKNRDLFVKGLLEEEGYVMYRGNIGDINVSDGSRITESA